MAKKRMALEDYKKLAGKYFRNCDRINAQSQDAKTVPKPYTLSGLLCVMGLSREQFLALSKNRDGRKFVNYVLMKIEAFIEENALSGKISASAAANSLKYSLGWDDRAENTKEASFEVYLSPEAKQLGE